MHLAYAVVSFPMQTGWGYRLWSSTNLTDWADLGALTKDGTPSPLPRA